MDAGASGDGWAHHARGGGRRGRGTWRPRRRWRRGRREYDRVGHVRDGGFAVVALGGSARPHGGGGDGGRGDRGADRDAEGARRGMRTRWNVRRVACERGSGSGRVSRVVVASFDDVAVRARPPSSRHLGASGERRTVGSADAPEATRGGAAPPKRRSRAERTGARAREARRSAGRSSPRPPSRPSARQAFHQLRVSRPQGVRVGSLGRVARSTRRRLRARARPLIPSDQASVGVYARLEDSAPGDASRLQWRDKSIRFFS